VLVNLIIHSFPTIIKKDKSDLKSVCVYVPVYR